MDGFLAAGQKVNLFTVIGKCLGQRASFGISTSLTERRRQPSLGLIQPRLVVKTEPQSSEYAFGTKRRRWSCWSSILACWMLTQRPETAEGYSEGLSGSDVVITSLLICPRDLSSQRSMSSFKCLQELQAGAIDQICQLRPGNIKPNAQLPNLCYLWLSPLCSCSILGRFQRSRRL